MDAKAGEIIRFGWHKITINIKKMGDANTPFLTNFGEFPKSEYLRIMPLTIVW